MKWLVYPIMALVALLTIPAFALNYGSGTYGSCQYSSCGITISSSGSVSLNVAPAAGGACTIQNNAVSVFTDDSNGYSLTMSDSTTNTSLVNGGSSVSAISATRASPTALGPNYWGYRVDGLGGFGSGPTSAQSNNVPNSTTFAAVPSSSTTPDTLSTTTVAANPAVKTTVWYGVCANTSIPSGTYTTQVTYTAVTN